MLTLLSLCYGNAQSGISGARYGRVISIAGHTRPDERVIAPIPNKSQDLKQAFIQKSYSVALSLVRQEGFLIAVGYSFNPFDRSSYHRILEALGQSKERTLFLVSPQASELAKRISNEYPALTVRGSERHSGSGQRIHFEVSSSGQHSIPYCSQYGGRTLLFALIAFVRVKRRRFLMEFPNPKSELVQRLDPGGY